MVRADDGRVQHEPLGVGLLQHLEDGLPAAQLGPAVEALVDRVVLAEALGEIGGSSRSGRTRSGDPEYGVEEEAVVGGVASGVAGLTGEQGL
jgi:hypothetical protein